MRVCDRHPDRPAVDCLVIERDDERVDVCAECKTDVLTFLHTAEEAPKKRGRPKDLAKAN
jgi:hypothetical protein